MSYLRTTQKHLRDWDLTLHRLQWSINSQRNTTSGFCPNELIFDYKPIDVIQNRLVADIQDDECSPTVIPLHEISFQLAIDKIERERQRWKKRFDEKHSRPTTYDEGDLVLIENDYHYCIVKRVIRKDRYLIEDIPGVQITGGKFYSMFSSDRIKG